MTATCAFMNKQFFPCNIRNKQKNEQQVDRKRRCNTWLSSQQPVLLPYLKLDENTRFIDQSKEQFIEKQDTTVNQCGHHLSSVTLNNLSSKRVRSEPLDGTYDHPTTHIGRISATNHFSCDSTEHTRCRGKVTEHLVPSNDSEDQAGYVDH